MSQSMTRIALIHPTVPPQTGPVANLMYHHLRLLNAAGYPLRVVACQRDEAYYEASFYHQVDFFTIDLNAEPAQLEAELTAALTDAQVWLVYDLLTEPSHLGMTHALAAVFQEQAARSQSAPPRLISLSVTRPGRPDGSGLTTHPWPGVNYAAGPVLAGAVEQRLGLAPQTVSRVPPGVDEAEFWRLGAPGRALSAALDLTQAGPVLLLPPAPTPADLRQALEVLAALNAQQPRAHLLVGGLTAADPAAAALEAVCKDSGWAAHVHFAWQAVPDPDDPADLEDACVTSPELHALADLLFVPRAGTNATVAIQTAALARLPAIIPTPADASSPPEDAYPADASPAQIAAHITRRCAADPAIRARRQVLAQATWGAVLTGVLIPLLEGS